MDIQKIEWARDAYQVGTRQMHAAAASNVDATQWIVWETWQPGSDVRKIIADTPEQAIAEFIRTEAP